MRKIIIAALAATMFASPVLAAAPKVAPAQTQQAAQALDLRIDVRNDRRDDRRWDRHDRRYDNRRDARRHWHAPPPRVVQHRKWSRGQRFDHRWAPNYRVIAQPHYYRLHAPPRGHRWVQSGNDAVLIALTTGIVAAVIAGAVY